MRRRSSAWSTGSSTRGIFARALALAWGGDGDGDGRLGRRRAGGRQGDARDGRGPGHGSPGGRSRAAARARRQGRRCGPARRPTSSPRSCRAATRSCTSSGASRSRIPRRSMRRTTGRSWSRSRRRRPPGTRRIIFLSVPGADPDHQHPFLRAKGMAERSLAGSGLDYAILRCTHAYGLGGLWFTATVHGALATPPFTCGPGTQELAPVLADDIGAVVAAMDDRAAPLGGTWGLEGPDVLTADRLRLAASRRRRARRPTRTARRPPRRSPRCWAHRSTR